MHAVLDTVTISAVGASIWTRRKSWRSFTWQQVLSIGISLGGLGYVLCLPAAGSVLGRALFAATGICHVRDFIGQLALLAGASCIICAIAFRLVPRSRMEEFMIRIEVPGALASFGMLVCLLFSHNTKNGSPPPDFMDVPLDGWLRAYWIIYCGMHLYLAAYAIRLLAILRRDERSMLSADLFIAASCVAACSSIARIVTVTVPGLRVPDGAIWTLISTAVVLACLAASVSWRRGAKLSDKTLQPSLW